MFSCRFHHTTPRFRKTRSFPNGCANNSVVANKKKKRKEKKDLLLRIFLSISGPPIFLRYKRGVFRNLFCSHIFHEIYVYFFLQNKNDKKSFHDRIILSLTRVFNLFTRIFGGETTPVRSSLVTFLFSLVLNVKNNRQTTSIFTQDSLIFYFFKHFYSCFAGAKWYFCHPGRIPRAPRILARPWNSVVGTNTKNSKLPRKSLR